MQVRFWGVRGSTPTPQIENLAFGGNTACVEVRSASGQMVIIDGGTGVRNLGQMLARERRQKLSVHLLLTHFHWDHIQGIPFFVPLYCADNDITFYAHAELGPLRERLAGQMCKPYFPVSLEVAAPRRFVEIDQKCVSIGDLRIYPFELNHPQGAYGYRLESGGHSRGVRERPGTRQQQTGQHPAGARAGRRHADLRCAVHARRIRLAPRAGATAPGWKARAWPARRACGRLILFHHDPWHNDQSCWRLGAKRGRSSRIRL